jgi:hypothetical protein
MKHILLIIIPLVLAACSSSPTVVESDTGLVYPARHLDRLRGMASGQRDAEQHAFSDAILRLPRTPTTEHGVYYPGDIKVITWKYRKAPKYLALRKGILPNGMTLWQGPTPPSGFYGSKLTTTYLQ